MFELSSHPSLFILEKTQDASNMTLPMNTYQHWIRRIVISSLKLHHGSIEQRVALLNSNQNNLIFESQWCSRMCCYAISEVLGNIRVSSIPQRDRIRSVRIISSSRHNRHNITNVRTKGWTCSKLKHGSLPNKCSLVEQKNPFFLQNMYHVHSARPNLAVFLWSPHFRVGFPSWRRTLILYVLYVEVSLLTYKPYQNVPITEDGIATSEFIDATEGVVKLFDLLGSSAFAVVQNDMNGNIKVRAI